MIKESVLPKGNLAFFVSLSFALALALAVLLLDTSLTLTLCGIIAFVVAGFFIRPPKTFYVLGLFLLAAGLGLPLPGVIGGASGSDELHRLALFGFNLRIPIAYLPFILALSMTAISSTSRGSWLPLTLKGRAMLTLPLKAILLYGLVSALWVVDYGSWLIYYLMWVFYIIFVFSQTSVLLARAPTQLRKVIDFYILCCTILSIVAILQFLVTRDFLRAANPIPLLGAGPVSLLLVPLLPLALSLYLAERRKAYLMAAGVVALNTALLFNRTAYIAAIVAILLFLGLNTSFPRIRKLISVSFLGVVLVGGLAYAVGGEFLGERVQGIRNVTYIWFGEPAVGVPDWHRALIRDASIAIIKDRPWLGTGIGLDNYLHYFSSAIPIDERLRSKAHNLYLSSLAEMGIFGYAFLIGFLVAVFYFLWAYGNTIRDPRSRVIARGFTSGHISALVIFAGSEGISAPFVWFFWGLAIAFLESALRRQSSGISSATK